MTPEQFQARFNSRTAAYLKDQVAAIDDRPVLVTIDPAANSPAGHALAVALANLLARAHRRLAFAGDLSVPLACPSVFGEQTLGEATNGLALAINPHIEILAAEGVPDPLLTISVGNPSLRTDLHVGCDGWRATFGPEATIVDRPASIWGAGLTACLTASAAFHAMLGRRGELGASYSLWAYGALGEEDGPDVELVDVGRVLQAGAGAVGSALDFWMRLFGAAGAWTIVDGDVVDASNLNRQLIFIAKDVGYPSGTAEMKAAAAAKRLGPIAKPIPSWYGEDREVVDAEFDVVLALANERGVRGRLQHRQPPVLLHATTSNNWQAQLHRHVAGRDDCIRCRIPGDLPRLACSIGDLGEPRPVDASLPFLSGTAGLLLATEVARLQIGPYPPDQINFRSVTMSDAVPGRPQALRRQCRDACDGWLDVETVKGLNSGNRHLTILG